MRTNKSCLPGFVGRAQRSLVVIGALLALSLFLCVTRSASAITITGNLLTDPSFNSGSQPLLLFTNTTSDRWLAENAALIVGSENSVTPNSPDGMLRIAEDILTASQVRQVVDISAFSAAVDAGNAFATFRAEYNAGGSGARAGAVLSAYGAGIVGLGAPVLLSQSDVDFLDNVTNTWETRGVGEGFLFPLPVLTRQLQAQMFFTNGTISLNGYVDSSLLTVTIIPEPSTLALLGLGMSSLLFLSRRRRE